MVEEGQSVKKVGDKWLIHIERERGMVLLQIKMVILPYCALFSSPRTGKMDENSLLSELLPLGIKFLHTARTTKQGLLQIKMVVFSYWVFLLSPRTSEMDKDSLLSKLLPLGMKI